jgi:hypothetical protein
MLDRRGVSHNLRRLERLFNEAIKRPSTYKLANFYSKVAVLEACSWLEICIDKIFEDIYNAQLIDAGNKTDFQRTIDKNYGFHYMNNIRERLSKNLIGLIHIERIELRLNGRVEFNTMKAALGNLKTIRDTFAHDHVSGSALTVHTVTQTISNFSQACSGLRLLERELQRITFT